MGLEENPGYISQEPTLLATRLHHSPTCDVMMAKLATKEQTSASKPLFHFSPSVVPAQSRSKNNWWGQSKLAKQTLHDESAPGKPMLGKTWHIVMHGTNSDKTKNQSLRTTQLWKTVPHHPDHMAHTSTNTCIIETSVPLPYCGSNQLCLFTVLGSFQWDMGCVQSFPRPWEMSWFPVNCLNLGKFTLF